MLVAMVVENLVVKEGAELVVERVIWKEEGLQALPEEEKEEKEVELKVMKEQGNWVFVFVFD